MTEKQAERAADLISTRDRLKKDIELLDEAVTLKACHYRIADMHQNHSSFLLDKRGSQALKAFLKGELSRHIIEIKNELKGLGIEVVA